jgi:hypothetical protein
MIDDIPARILVPIHKILERAIADETAMMTNLPRQVPLAAGRTDLQCHTSTTNIIHATMDLVTTIKREVASVTTGVAVATA